MFWDRYKIWNRKKKDVSNVVGTNIKVKWRPVVFEQITKVWGIGTIGITKKWWSNFKCKKGTTEEKKMTTAPANDNNKGAMIFDDSFYRHVGFIDVDLLKIDAEYNPIEEEGDNHLNIILCADYAKIDSKKEEIKIKATACSVEIEKEGSQETTTFDAKNRKQKRDAFYNDKEKSFITNNIKMNGVSSKEIVNHNVLKFINLYFDNRLNGTKVNDICYAPWNHVFTWSMSSPNFGMWTIYVSNKYLNFGIFHNIKNKKNGFTFQRNKQKRW